MYSTKRLSVHGLERLQCLVSDMKLEQRLDSKKSFVYLVIQIGATKAPLGSRVRQLRSFRASTILVRTFLRLITATTTKMQVKRSTSSLFILAECVPLVGYVFGLPFPMFRRQLPRNTVIMRIRVPYLLSTGLDPCIKQLEDTMAQYPLNGGGGCVCDSILLAPT
ncbi:hypothetical protein A7U60_g3712 [Sanghuangporus baumii]|uniref:Uncharacterized protein n=1 Tax=Sanghuangporus baumii TaxID=108892 RepID=A0A9Q5HZX6_SANBA|nr:hypothetical protein A7U60_g3712 [Sanghuangporus baumii]